MRVLQRSCASCWFVLVAHAACRVLAHSTAVYSAQKKLSKTLWQEPLTSAHLGELAQTKKKGKGSVPAAHVLISIKVGP